MQFVKVFLGPSGWDVTVYKLYAVYGVHVQPAVMCVSPIQNCCYKTKESKILLCCLTWHGHVFKNSQRHEACCSSDWYNIKFLYVPVAICVHLFICRLWGTFNWDPLECYWSWDTSSCRCWSYGVASVRIWTQRGAERMPVVSEFLICLTR
jgi:hypothetical protein